MVKFYKVRDVEKYIATNYKSCAVITYSSSIISVDNYCFKYPKRDNEVLQEIEADVFLDMYDRVNANLIDLVGQKSKGLKALLPEATTETSNH